MATTKIKELMGVSEAAAYLTEVLGRGYSESSIYGYIQGGIWKEGDEYIDDAIPNGKQRRIKVRVKKILRDRGIEPY